MICKIRKNNVNGGRCPPYGAEIDQLGEDFDYRGKLRDEKWCKELAHEIAATHKKLVDRGRLDSFEKIF